MRTLPPLLAAFALAAWGCTSSVARCTPDAGEGLKHCTATVDGGSPDCAPTEACAPFVQEGNERCIQFCNAGGGCPAGTLCAAVAVGLCAADGGSRDGGNDDPGTPHPSCVTDFLCYPNRC